LEDFIFPSRVNYMGHLGTRQYARLVDEWVGAVGLDVHEYGTHSLRRTNPYDVRKDVDVTGFEPVARNPHNRRFIVRGAIELVAEQPCWIGLPTTARSLRPAMTASASKPAPLHPKPERKKHQLDPKPAMRGIPSSRVTSQLKSRRNSQCK
jgi:hypothetical protein